jgi:hypothetical protein
MIALTLAISTTTTKKIIVEARRRWGVKLLQENTRIYTKPNPLAPKLRKVTANSPSPHAPYSSAVPTSWQPKSSSTDKTTHAITLVSSPTMKALPVRPPSMEPPT